MQIYKWGDYVWFFSKTEIFYLFYNGHFLGSRKIPLVIIKEMTLIEQYQHKEELTTLAKSLIEEQFNENI
jgi:hypothetical protein